MGGKCDQQVTALGVELRNGDFQNLRKLRVGGLKSVQPACFKGGWGSRGGRRWELCSWCGSNSKLEGLSHYQNEGEPQ